MREKLGNSMSRLRLNLEPRQMQYRKDIDGLRSLAILPVVAYHAGLNIPGGFIGVDIFFVISGFLITSVILEGVETGEFTFADFYFRRAKRLLPALFFMILLTAIASLFILSPSEYKDFSTSTVTATFFVSNLFFNHSIDYFSASAETMPLLHTWSLAVEEQFYIVWPVLILGFVWLMKRGRKLAVWGLLLLICSLSLLAAQYAAEKFPQAGFYLTPFRLWELGAGGLLVFVLRAKNQLGASIANGFFLSGLGMVGVSIMFLHQDVQFPGFSALPVVLGTCLMLWTGNMQGQQIARIFHLPPLIYIGKLSYSLYLMHWPVFALYRVYMGGAETGSIPLLLVALSFALAMISYHLVEKPIRFKGSKPAVWSGVAAAALVVVGAHASALTSGGYAKRVGEDAIPAYAADLDVMWAWPCKEEGIGRALGKACHIGTSWERAKTRYILWGDSHAGHFAPLLEHAAKDDKVSIIFIRGCPSFIDDKTVRRILKGSTEYSRNCGIQQDRILKWLWLERKSIDGVILASAWSGYAKSLFETDQNLRSKDESVRLIENGTRAVISKIPKSVPVTVLSEVPRPNRKFTNCIQSANGWIKRKTHETKCEPLDRTKIDKWHIPTDRALSKAVKGRKNAHVLNSVKRMCSAQSCPVYIEDRVFYRDNHHLRRNLTPSEKDWLVEQLKLREIFAAEAP